MGAGRARPSPPSRLLPLRPPGPGALGSPAPGFLFKMASPAAAQARKLLRDLMLRPPLLAARSQVSAPRGRSPAALLAAASSLLAVRARRCGRCTPGSDARSGARAHGGLPSPPLGCGSGVQGGDAESSAGLSSVSRAHVESAGPAPGAERPVKKFLGPGFGVLRFYYLLCQWSFGNVLTLERLS